MLFHCTHDAQDERCFPPGWLKGRRVLEIGAGTGLVGLTLALLGAQVRCPKDPRPGNTVTQRTVI